MRTLFILLLIIGCTKVSHRKVELPKIQEPELERLETDIPYSEKIDVMVAFLWPERIETEQQKRSVRSLIAGSRKLKDLQDGYFDKKLDLARAWKKEECDCVLNGLCDETPPETTMERCTELEEATFANERILPSIYEIVEEMKTSIRDAGGEWLKTHTDFPESPVSELSFDRSMLILPVFASEESGQYAEIPYQLRRSGSYDSFKVVFQDAHNRGEWTFDMVIQRTNEALKFQGKLFLKKKNSVREGIVYWMNPVVI